MTKNCTSNSVKSLSSFIRWAVSASRRSVAKIAVECSSAKSAVNSLTCWEKTNNKNIVSVYFYNGKANNQRSAFSPRIFLAIPFDMGEKMQQDSRKKGKQKRNEQQLGITLGSSGKGQGARSQEPGRGWLGKSQVEQLLQLQLLVGYKTTHTRACNHIGSRCVVVHVLSLSFVGGWAGGSGRFLLDFLLLSSIFFSTFQFHFPGAYF
jgi:hypothetical protein